MGFCFLNSLLHMLEVHECLTLCDKTGYAVGELDMNVIPTIVDDRGATAYTTNPVTVREGGPLPRSLACPAPG